MCGIRGLQLRDSGCFRFRRGWGGCRRLQVGNEMFLPVGTADRVSGLEAFQFETLYARTGGATVARRNAGDADMLEHCQFEMLCISNHTACRFAEKTRFFRSLWAGRRCAAASRFIFFKVETLCLAGHGKTGQDILPRWHGRCFAAALFRVPPELFQVETLCASGHTGCGFAKTARFFYSFWPDRLAFYLR